VIGPVLQFEDLQKLCKPGEAPTRATVEAWARDQGIAYRYDRKGGIWTTVDALNRALGVSAGALAAAASNDSAPYGADEVM
jgi:hypothetical protein